MCFIATLFDSDTLSERICHLVSDGELQRHVFACVVMQIEDLFLVCGLFIKFAVDFLRRTVPWNCSVYDILKLLGKYLSRVLKFGLAPRGLRTGPCHLVSGFGNVCCR